MTCFCDIPLSRISEHVNIYGAYGIGLSREWASRWELTPVNYIAPNSDAAQCLNELYYSAVIEAKTRSNPTFLNHFYRLARFIKPTTGILKRRNRWREQDFYQESEWRYVPNEWIYGDRGTKVATSLDWLRHPERVPRLKTYLYDSDFSDADLLSRLNQQTKEVASLKFEPADVNYIFVRSDNEVRSLIEFIAANLPRISTQDAQLLTSRIFTLGQLQRDM